LTVVILEGPDGSGKTALARALTADGAPFASVELRHTSQPKHPMGAYWEYLDEVARMARCDLWPDSLVVYDRFHVGELVYGPVMRDGCDMTMADLATLESMLDQMHVVRVLLHAPGDVILRRAYERGEDFVSETQLAEVVRRYDQLGAYLSDRYGWHTYDTYVSPLEYLAREVARHAKVAATKREVAARA
jgi:thymidylate kinase